MLLFEECKVRWREDGVGKNQLWNKNPKSVLVTNLFAACAINLHYHVFFSFLFFPRGPSEEEERTMVVWISQKVWVWGQVLSIVEKVEIYRFNTVATYDHTYPAGLSSHHVVSIVPGKLVWSTRDPGYS